MGVLALWRYPVKAMLGELLDAVEIGPGGCTGDRRWIVVDARTGERIANKRGPTDPRLRACRAELVEDRLRVTLPGGEVLEGAEITAALSELLERPVRLERSAAPATGRFAATGAHHDLAPIHLITTSTLARLRALAPESDWEVRRFRPNLVLDDGDPPPGFAEDALLGGRLRGESGLELTVGLPDAALRRPDARAGRAPRRSRDPAHAGPRAPDRPRPRRPAGLRRRLRRGRPRGADPVGERLGVEPGATPPADAIAAALARVTGG